MEKQKSVVVWELNSEGIQMNEDLKLALQLCSGGAIGALITAFVNYQRSKVPKISYDAIVETVFDKNTTIGKYQIEVLLKSTDENGVLALDTCENAHLFRVTLKNTSNHSYGKFNLGINFPKTMKPLVMNSTAITRKHSIISPTEIDPNTDIYELDYSITPFNRQDVAEIQILFTKLSKDDSIPVVITNEDAQLTNINALKKDISNIALDVLSSQTAFRIPYLIFRRII